MIGWNMILVYLNLGLVLAFPKKETKRNYQNGEQSNHPQHQCDPENIKQAFINLSTAGPPRTDSFHLSTSESVHDRIPTVKLTIPGKTFLKSGSRTSVTFKL